MGLIRVGRERETEKIERKGRKEGKEEREYKPAKVNKETMPYITPRVCNIIKKVSGRVWLC